MRRRAVIVDIDGTVAHRTLREWFEYDKAHTDAPDKAIISLLNILSRDKVLLLFVSGREDDSRDVTEKWLRRHCPPYTALYMRAAGDHREDSTVKREIYDNHIKHFYDVLFVLDDRNQVVDMWREIGLKCLQVQPGDF